MPSRLAGLRLLDVPFPGCSLRGPGCWGILGFSGCRPTRRDGPTFELRIEPPALTGRLGCRSFRCLILRTRLLQKLYIGMSLFVRKCNEGMVGPVRAPSIDSILVVAVCL